jgi:hypothetical protein
MWAAGVLVSMVVSLCASLVAALAAGTVCGTPASASNRNNGLELLTFAAAVIALPWLIVAATTRGPRGRILLGGVLGIMPIILFAITHLRVDSWVSNAFCVPW